MKRIESEPGATIDLLLNSSPPNSTLWRPKRDLLAAHQFAQTRLVWSQTKVNQMLYLTFHSKRHFWKVFGRDSSKACPALSSGLGTELVFGICLVFFFFFRGCRFFWTFSSRPGDMISEQFCAGRRRTPQNGRCYLCWPGQNRKQLYVWLKSGYQNNIKYKNL
jgi:hypothetical protein